MVSQSQAEGPLLTVPRARVLAQIEALGLPRNSLSVVLLPDRGDVPGAGPAYGPQEQAVLQVALPLLASPALVARIRAVLDDGHALSTWAVTGAGNDPALTSYLLLAHDEAPDAFRIRPVEDRATLVRTFLAYLDLGLPAQAGDGFELPVGAFTLLVALCDLFRRAGFASGLDHDAARAEFSSDDVAQALRDGSTSGDPRWLLPHLLAILPEPREVPDPARFLPVLASAGWTTGGRDGVKLSEMGVRFANDLDRRLALLSFWAAGATEQGEPASRSSLLVRSPWRIWCMDVGCEDGSRVAGAAVDLADAYGVLEELLTPVGVPALLEAARPVVVQPAAAGARPRPRPVAVPGGAAPAAPGTGPAPKAPAARRFCPNCGQPIAANARFCGSCGQTLT